ncbi:acid beta-fructofuranosidase-like [Hibiscus syriacus]|uniref:acid beta-fructofuranosidase-like n=1 Tax=Hibiscus syriacus TaxID=106335 RepID=UPI001923DBAA|nr:acid beta-fructofuranosidase-like [Hibiscus syriacus]
MVDSNPLLPVSSSNESSDSGPGQVTCRRPIKVVPSIFVGMLAVGFFAAFFISINGSDDYVDVHRDRGGSLASTSSVDNKPTASQPVSRGPGAGVSEKSNLRLGGHLLAYPWNNSMLSWQRTAFHFQPEKNWMNDPNGPLFYKGWYHFFYQYNPNAAVWGDIVWGHAVSKDLIDWLHLPLAMVADQWYDKNGVWTGSATVLHDGKIVMLYTGSTIEGVQVQNLAYPANQSDPLLVHWVKYPHNPVLVPPPGIGPDDFRDPTTAWLTSEGKWRISIGSKINKTGIALVYDTEDFINYEILDGLLHAVPGTGMWECVDFFPVSKTGKNGSGHGVKHVVKASLDDNRHDYYAIGTYNDKNGTWIPDRPEIDVGVGLRYDYGIFYAAKSFYDPNKKRRVLWGWIGESDSEAADVKKGWASVQSIPRMILFDEKTGTHLLQWPVEETDSLRLKCKEFNQVTIQAGSVIPLDVDSATQLDIEAEFKLDNEVLEKVIASSDASFDCKTSGGAAERGALGPFGLLVLADESRSEQTPVYFYIAKGPEGNLNTFFCSDQSRSSKASDVDKRIYGSSVPVLEGENLSLRILVDHSIIESYGQGGRTVITSRVYPMEAIYGAAKVVLFNNATGIDVNASVKIWQMNSAFIQPYPLIHSL